MSDSLIAKEAVKIHLLKSGMIYDKITILLLVFIILLGILIIIVKCSGV